jgi:hypothetical protein
MLISGRPEINILMHSNIVKQGNYSAYFWSVGILPAFRTGYARTKILTSKTIQAIHPLETQAGSLSSGKLCVYEPRKSI